MSTFVVGGPFSGKTVEHETPYFRAMEPFHPIRFCRSDSDSDGPEITCRTLTYSRRVWRMGDEDRALYALEGLSDLDVLELLLITYRDAVERAEHLSPT